MSFYTEKKFQKETHKEYLLSHQEKGNNTTTVNNHHKYLNAFFRWPVEEDIVKENPCNGIKKQKEDIHIHVFTDEEEKLIVSLDE
ncbi:phage integrase SAM-like domain-containing protein [Alteribacillus sp. JSM 102045]|uniref:phage integrase SAM-like domain-containing protein n=1 Tax=Alteribacillus sp. JSM 102045 TaxID=1562101 RepID=UPI0035C26B22